MVTCINYSYCTFIFTSFNVRTWAKRSTGRSCCYWV